MIPAYTLVPAEESGLRLVEGLTSEEGRLEVLVDGEWGTICREGFDDGDAATACRIMGYPYVK